MCIRLIIRLIEVLLTSEAIVPSLLTTFFSDGAEFAAALLLVSSGVGTEVAELLSEFEPVLALVVFSSDFLTFPVELLLTVLFAVVVS